MENFLTDEITTQVTTAFSKNLKEPVRLIYFDSTEGCEYCNETN